MPNPTVQPPAPPPDLDDQATAPTTLQAVIGQRRAVRQLEIALAAHRRDIQIGRPSAFPHVLLDGPAGTGKSLLASVVAKELGVPFTEILGQSLATGEDVYAAMMEVREFGLLLVDEVHLASVAAQTLLLRGVEDRVLMLPKRGGRRGGSPTKHVSIPLPRFSLIIASTNPERLLAPLRDRMSLTLHLEHYEPEDLARLCQARASALGWNAPPIVYEHIGRCAKGVARGALRLLQAAHRVARANVAHSISPAHFSHAAQMEGLDPKLGIDRTERAYLRVLAESDEPRRVSTIAARLGLPTRQVSEVLEPFLLRSELIVRTDAGRQLTQRGRDECIRIFGGNGHE